MNGNDIMESLEYLSDGLIDRYAETEKKKSSGIKYILPFAAVLIIVFTAAGVFMNRAPETVPGTTAGAADGVQPAFGDFSTITAEEFAEYELLSEDSTLSFPLYENPYPVGHGGPEYEITDDIKKGLYEKSEKFLKDTGLYDLCSGMELNEIMGLVIADCGEIKLYTSPYHVSLWQNGNKSYKNITDSDIISLFYDDIYIKTMCGLAEIKNPAVRRKGEEIIIYEKGGSPEENIINSFFSSVSLTCGEDFISVSTYCAEKGEPLKSEALSPARAKPSYDGDYKGFSVSYYQEAVKGYIMPCYKFFYQNGENYYVYTVPLYNTD